MSFDAALIRVRTSDGRFWQSCDIIESAFPQVLENLPKNISIIESSEEAFIDAVSLAGKKHKKLVVFFNSHITDIPKVLTEAKASIDISQLHFIIQVYGDMTVEVKRWIDLDKILKGLKVKIVCSSRPHLEQTKKLVKNPKNLELLPYPLAESFLGSIPQNNTQDNLIQMIYAGRICLGKNVIPLMLDFLKASTVNKNIKLSICGRFTNEGHHFHGVKSKENSIQKSFYEIIESSNGKIRYLGDLSQKQLISEYDKSDYFISMSTYHDEDFGVAVTQALARGCKTILSDWGGYKDHPCIEYINLEYSENQIPVYKRKNLLKILKTLRQRPEDKAQTQMRIFKKYSPKSVAEKFNQIITNKFSHYEGQSNLFFQYAQMFEKEHGSPYRNIKSAPNIQKLYYELYQDFGAPRLING